MPYIESLSAKHQLKSAHIGKALLSGHALRLGWGLQLEEPQKTVVSCSHIRKHLNPRPYLRGRGVLLVRDAGIYNPHSIGLQYLRQQHVLKQPQPCRKLPVINLGVWPSPPTRRLCSRQQQGPQPYMGTSGATGQCSRPQWDAAWCRMLKRCMS